MKSFSLKTTEEHHKRASGAPVESLSTKSPFQSDGSFANLNNSCETTQQDKSAERGNQFKMERRHSSGNCIKDGILTHWYKAKAISFGF